MIFKLLNPPIIIIIIHISRAEQYTLIIPAPLPNIILLGDFNFPLINWSNPNCQCPFSIHLVHRSDRLFLSQQVAEPTQNSNILDLIFCPNDLIYSIDICDTFISDHSMLTVETNVSMSPPLFPQNLNPAITVFDKLEINKANWANLILAIKQIDWSTVLDSSTTCLIPFTDIIRQICSLHTPIKGTKKVKRVSVFFFRERKILMRKRTKLRKKVHTNPSFTSKIMSIEQSICDSLSKEKLYDETLAVTMIESDPSFFFRYAKKFSICTNAIGPLLNPDIHLLTDNKTEMCSILLDQFNSVFSTPKPNMIISDPVSFLSCQSIPLGDEINYISDIDVPILSLVTNISREITGQYL